VLTVVRAEHSLVAESKPKHVIFHGLILMRQKHRNHRQIRILHNNQCQAYSKRVYHQHRAHQLRSPLYVMLLPPPPLCRQDLRQVQQH